MQNPQAFHNGKSVHNILLPDTPMNRQMDILNRSAGTGSQAAENAVGAG